MSLIIPFGVSKATFRNVGGGEFEAVYDDIDINDGFSFDLQCPYGRFDVIR